MTGPRPCQTRGREGQNTSITLWGVALGHVPGPAPARHRANRRGPRAAACSAPPGAARGRCVAGPRARACRIGIMCGMWRDLLRAADDFRIVSGYRRYDTGGCECDRPARGRLHSGRTAPPCGTSPRPCVSGSGSRDRHDKGASQCQVDF
jgi:hypothetical protein